MRGRRGDLRGGQVLGRCLSCANEVRAAVPFALTWSTEGLVNFFEDASCGCGFEAQYVVVFIAPVSGTYQIDAAAVDSVLSILSGACGTTALACNDDFGDGFESRVTLPMTAGDVVSLVVGELCKTSGSGALSVQLL